MSGINQTYYPPSLHNLTEPSIANNSNNNFMNRSNDSTNINIDHNNGYLIEMRDYPSDIRNNPPLLPPPSNSICFINLWSNTYLNSLITQNNRPSILNYKRKISLNFTLLLILTFFVALAAITLTEYFSDKFDDSKLHWATVFIALCCSLLIICQACTLVARLRKIHKWEDYCEHLRVGSELDITLESCDDNGEELIEEIPPTYQKARKDPPAYESPIKIV
jgi:hypothetical protein